ncbi:MAG: hypothetical protein R3F17_03785 [Planctomycetota bacterium]
MDPDIEVLDDPALMQDGRDPQIDRSHRGVVEGPRRRAGEPVWSSPAGPNRSGAGIPERDH